MAAGASVLLSSPVVSGRVRDDGVELAVGGADPVTVLCRIVVNAGGLFAPQIARLIDGLPKASIPAEFYAKGHYFMLSGRSPFSHLVYPVPVPGGLGVHVTLDLAGRARLGPDVSWVDGVDYAFDAGRAPAFYAEVRRYFPGLADGSLEPGYTGIRPKLGPAASPAHDFVVQGPRDHGASGLVNLYGIESPGLTAALPLADEVKRLLVD
jgi:L-2-hydroxyglutarate oxidase LhgO